MIFSTWNGSAFGERMRIASGGNVGVGTTSPASLLEIYGAGNTLRMDSAGNTAKTFLMRNVNTATAEIKTDGNLDINIEDANRTMRFLNGNTERMRITSAGNVGIGNTSPSQKLHVTGSILASSDVVAFSDKKLKENIKTLDGSKVYDMRGVSFTRKDTGKDSSGVIAQEIQKIAPELVTDNDGTLSVAYGNLTGYLIEAVKELKTEVEQLKKQIKNGNNL